MTVPAGAGDATNVPGGLLGKMSASVKRVAAERKATKEQERQRQDEAQRAAGRLLTKGLFGVTTIEVYENGYVRILGTSTTQTQHPFTKKNPPYEKLISIELSGPPQQHQQPTGLNTNNVALQAASQLLRSGSLFKTSIPGLAASGIAHVAQAKQGKSTLVISTDHAIHTLTNEAENDWGITVVKHEHEGVGRSLVDAATQTIGRRQDRPAAYGYVEGASTAAIPQIPVQPAVPQPAAVPTMTDRMRELASLHNEGILDDVEFAAAKAKLLESM